MNSKWTRRDFLKTGATLSAALPVMGMGLTTANAQTKEKEAVYKTQLYKSLGYRLEKTDTLAKAAKFIEEAVAMGYQGVEAWDWDVEIATARGIRKIAEANGIRIHSCCRAWTSFNNPQKVDTDIESVKKALRTARAYGADALLLVPCRINDNGVTPCKNFEITFDPGTCMVKSVCKGDNTPLKKYIELQNEATSVTYKCMEKIIPTAAYEGVTIALENVWNNLWVKPDFAAAFINSFNNHFVKMYFDLGNNAKYAKTEDWIRALGSKLIAKMHIKDFSIDYKNTSGGRFVPIGYGSIDWREVRNALEEVGYNGYVSTEDIDHYTLKEHVDILDAFFKGTLTLRYAEKVHYYDVHK